MMARLIDADKLLEIYKKWIPQLSSKEDEGDRRGVETCISVLEDMQTVDSVPVVRCRECKYHNKPPCPMRLSFNWTEDNDFAATEKGKKMINAKGEVIYTNSEIAYELGLSPATVNAIGKRLFGNGRIPHWTLNDAKLIVEYIKSISVEEDARRLSVLHDAVHEIMGDCKLDDADTRKRVDKDIHPVPKGGSTNGNDKGREYA